MTRHIPFNLLGFGVTLCGGVAIGVIASSPNFSLETVTPVPGSAENTSTGCSGYRLRPLIGDPAATNVVLTSASFRLRGGFTPTPPPQRSLGDLDDDGDVDGEDFMTFSNCFNGSLNPPLPSCGCPHADIDGDNDVDGNDFLTFSNCFNGSLNPPTCP